MREERFGNLTFRRSRVDSSSHFLLSYAAHSLNSCITNSQFVRRCSKSATSYIFIFFLLPQVLRCANVLSEIVGMSIIVHHKELETILVSCGLISRKFAPLSMLDGKGVTGEHII